MLLNCDELSHLAWFDSVCFDKEDLLLVSDCSSAFDVNQECLVRLAGNLLFVLSIEVSGTSVNYDHKSNCDSKSSIFHLPKSVVAQNQQLLGTYCDQLNANESLFPIYRLSQNIGNLFNNFNLFNSNSNNRSSENHQHSSLSSCKDTARQVLYTLVLEECGVRQGCTRNEFYIDFQDSFQVKKNGFSVSESSDTGRSIKFTCQTKRQCNEWISLVRCANHTCIQSLLLALHRRCQAARSEQTRLKALAHFHHHSVDESKQNTQATDDKEATDDERHTHTNSSVQLRAKSLHSDRVCRTSPPPPDYCAGNIDSSTDRLGIVRPLSRWILPDSTDSHQITARLDNLLKVNCENQPDLFEHQTANSVDSFKKQHTSSSVTFTLETEVVLYFNQGQTPSLQAQVECDLTGAIQTTNESRPSSSSTTASYASSSSSTSSLFTSTSWQQTSEIQKSRKVCFAKRFHLPIATLIDLQSKTKIDCIPIHVRLFDVIERLTNTRVVLGHSQLQLPVDWITCSLSTNDSLNSSSPTQTTIQANLTSLSPCDSIIGSVSLHFCPNPLSAFDANQPITSILAWKSSLSSISSRSNCEKLEMANHRLYQHLPGISNASLESSAIYCLPNNSHLFLNTIYRSFQFELPPSESLNSTSRKITITELMSEPTLALLLPQTIMNFFMEDEKRLMNCITYALGEVKPNHQRRQMQVLESHLRLVNLVTESINQLSQEQLAGHCFRASKHKLPLHLQFVPVNLHLQQSLFGDSNTIKSNQSDLTNDLSRLQVTNHFEHEHDQDEAIATTLNVFTHGAFCAHALGLDQGCQKYFRETCGIDRNEIEIGSQSSLLASRSSAPTQLGHTWIAMETYFRITHLGQQVSRLTNQLSQLMEQLSEAQSSYDSGACGQPSVANDNESNSIQVGNQTNGSSAASQLQFNLLQQRFAIRQQALVVHQQQLKSKLLSVFSKLEFQCQSIVSILDANQCETILSQLDGLRLSSSCQTNQQDTFPSNHTARPPPPTSSSNNRRPTGSSSFGIERTISCPINELVQSNDALKRAERQLNQLNRRCSSTERLDEANEFEPVELTQLNIRASVISMQSKLNQLTRLNESNSFAENSSSDLTSSQLLERLQEDLKPCFRKLATSVQNLQRTGAVCYALQALQLSRNQLEQFYILRLRRDALFSQALSTLVIALLSQLNSNEGPSLLVRLFEQRTLLCMFEGLLSCYADEIAMLQDMQFALNELTRCVRLKFVPIETPSNDQPGGLNSLPNHSHMSGPRLEGNGYNIHVVLPFLNLNITTPFECEIEAIFFNIGINENATLAETFGQVKLQEEMNKKNFLRLEQFVATKANISSRQLIDRLISLKSEVYASRAKNVRVLQLAEEIAYDLQALRFTNCKSGKDRTAMSVTLEQVRRAARLNSFDELQQPKLFQQILDTLRSEGTRRENTRKNVGVAKYAFNSLRVMTLPKYYRPPTGTYGNVQT